MQQSSWLLSGQAVSVTCRTGIHFRVLHACREYVFYGLLGAGMHMLEILPLASLLLGLFNTPLVPGEAPGLLACFDPSWEAPCLE